MLRVMAAVCGVRTGRTGHRTRRRRERLTTNPAAHNRETYDALAAEYRKRATSDFINDVPIVARVWYNLSLRDPNRPFRTLDVGCGHGVNVEMFARLGCISTGIDYSPEMVRVASEIAVRGTVVEGDFLSSHWPDTFDLVFAKAFFHLFPLAECVGVLEKMASLLGRNGLIYVATTIGEQSGEAFVPKIDYAGSKTRFRRTWSKLDLVEFMVSNGLEIVDEWENTETGRGKRWQNLLVSPRSV